LRSIFNILFIECGICEDIFLMLLDFKTWIAIELIFCDTFTQFLEKLLYISVGTNEFQCFKLCENFKNCFRDRKSQQNVLKFYYKSIEGVVKIVSYLHSICEYPHQASAELNIPCESDFTIIFHCFYLNYEY